MSVKEIELRASRAPIAIKCQQSLEAPAIQVDPESEQATLGTIGHKIVLEDCIDNKKLIDSKYIADEAAKYNLSSSDLQFLVTRALQVFEDKLQPNFIENKAEYGVEQELSLKLQIAGDKSVKFTGHADLIASANIKGVLRGHIFDLKTGYRRTESSYYQLKIYALMYVIASGAQYCKISLIWLREPNESLFETYEFTRAELIKFRDELIEAFTNPKPKYVPGSHCNFCPRVNHCPGFDSLIGNVAKFIQSDSLESNLNIDNLIQKGKLLDFYDACDKLEKMAKQARSLVKDEVKRRGKIQVNETQELRAIQSNKSSIVPSLALPVLLDYTTREDINKIIKINKSDAVKLVREGAKEGEKKIDKERAFLNDLAERNAIKTNHFTQVRIVNIKK